MRLHQFGASTSRHHSQSEASVSRHTGDAGDLPLVYLPMYSVYSTMGCPRDLRAEVTISRQVSGATPVRFRQDGFVQGRTRRAGSGGTEDTESASIGLGKVNVKRDC